MEREGAVAALCLLHLRLVAQGQEAQRRQSTASRLDGLGVAATEVVEALDRLDPTGAVRERLNERAGEATRVLRLDR